MNITYMLFKPEMVRAQIDGRKTQTRRIMDPQLENGWEFGTASEPGIRYGKIMSAHPRRRRFGVFIHRRSMGKGSGKYEHDLIPCPYGGPGDLVYVRENILQSKVSFHDVCGEMKTRWTRDKVEYLADTPKPEKRFLTPDMYGSPFMDSRPSIHMPRWASRLTLEITDVRVERVQDISEKDARHEGLAHTTKDGGTTWKWGIPDSDGLPGNDDSGWPWSEWETCAREAFARLWESIHGPGSWETNNWVWVIEFRAHCSNVDALIAQREAASNRVDKIGHRE